MIATNRTTRLIQKLFLKPRQRQTVSYFSRYVIDDKAMAQAQAEEDNSSSTKESSEVADTLVVPKETLY